MSADELRGSKTGRALRAQTPNQQRTERSEVPTIPTTNSGLGEDQRKRAAASMAGHGCDGFASQALFERPSTQAKSGSNLDQH